MYSAAARRFLCRSRFRSVPRTSATVFNVIRFSTIDSGSYQIPNHERIQPEAPYYYAEAPSPTTSTAKSSSGAVKDGAWRNQKSSGGGGRAGVDYQEEQARVLEASLNYVNKFGWNEEAMISGAREVGLSPLLVGAFPRKEAALVEFFMDMCLERLIDKVESDKELKNSIPSDRIANLVRIRLEMQEPYISKWSQALSIQAQPSNVATSLKQRTMLVDEIWHAVGEETNDIDWYVNRTILGGIYSATEIFMLTDNSPEFKDTWSFLHNRIRDAFDLKKTVQEARYLAEAVGAGMGKSVEGFMKSVFPGSR